MHSPTPSAPAGSIVCFGEALIDFLEQPPVSPRQPHTFVQHAGGAPANVAVAVARLGGRAAFVGMFGADPFGDFLLDSLAAAGVDTACALRTSAAKTALAFVALDAHGERSFSFYRPPAADLLFRAEHFGDACFADAAAFHICSNSLTEPPIAEATLAGMARARAAGALVSFDMNLRPALWPAGADPHPVLWRALRAADLVKLSAEEFAHLAAARGGEAGVLDALWQGHARALVVTHGADPLRWFTPQRRGSVPAFRVRAVDTTAAGDAFVGGLLYALAADGVAADSLPAFAADAARFEHTLRFAAACGARAVTRHGAFAAMPTLAEVETLLEENA